MPTDLASAPVEIVLRVAAVRAGFFGLSDVETLATAQIEPRLGGDSENPITLDFSDVRFWDISALLWLVIALDHYRRAWGVVFRLRLPAPNPDMSTGELDACVRSADYLRRWRFDRALCKIDVDLTKLLVPEQRDYFSPVEPREHFLAAKVRGESGILQSLISRRLVEIRDLSDQDWIGSTLISAQRIAQCIREFQAERIGDILTAQCNIDKRKADLFSDHLLTEALLNVQEHPNATIGMFAISVMGATKELILCVVDNGDPIPKTIYQRYCDDHSSADPMCEKDYAAENLRTDERALIADYATRKGITRKTGVAGENAGLGLTYIKEDTVGTFCGRLTIVTDGVRLTYANDPDSTPEITPLKSSWRGNLLRIAIPLSADARATVRTNPKP